MEEAELDIIKLQKIRPSKQHLIVFHCCSAFAQHLKHRIFQPCSASTALGRSNGLGCQISCILVGLGQFKLYKIFENISKHLSKNSKSFPICHLKDLVCFANRSASKDFITLNLSEDCWSCLLFGIVSCTKSGLGICYGRIADISEEKHTSSIQWKTHPCRRTRFALELYHIQEYRIHDYPGPRLTCSHSFSRLTSQDSCEFGLIRSRSQIQASLIAWACEVDPDNKTQWKSKLIKLKRFLVRFNGFGTRVFPVSKENLSPDLVSCDLGIICCCHQLLSTHLEARTATYAL